MGRFRKRWQIRRALARQRTFVYCPVCRFELVAGGIWLGTNATDPSLEAYDCGQCGQFSEWNFDALAPLLVRYSNPLGGGYITPDAAPPPRGGRAMRPFLAAGPREERTTTIASDQ